MKKIVLTVFAAAALAACSTPDIPVSDPHAISFGNVGTRVGLTDLQRDGFGVWAFINNSVQQNFPLMSNQKVEYSGDVWDYSPKKYWVDDTQYSFVATYPYFEDFYTLDSANGNVKFTVDYPYEDYLVATNTTDTSIEGYETTVQLNFQHILTSVGLNIWRDGAKHQNDQMRIRKVTLSNIRKEGTYSIVDGTWAYTNDKLTAAVANDNISDDDNIGAALVNDDGKFTTGGSAFNPFGDLLLIPQTIDGDNSISLRIEYDLKRNNAADWVSAELETVLPEITWAAGRRYTYNVVLSSVTDITIYYIQTKVDQWGTPQVGATVIIK